MAEEISLENKYLVYVKTYGQLARGEQVGSGQRAGFELAMSLASQDIMLKRGMRSKTEFNQDLARLSK